MKIKITLKLFHPLTLLFVLILILKLTDIIDLPWIFIFAPLWGPAIVCIGSYCVDVILDRWV